MHIFAYYHKIHALESPHLLKRWHLVLCDMEYFLPKVTRGDHRLQEQNLNRTLHRIQQLQRHRYWFTLLLGLLVFFDFLDTCMQWCKNTIQDIPRFLRSGPPIIYAFYALIAPSIADLFALARTRPIIESIPGDQWPLDYYNHRDFHIAASVLCLMLVWYIGKQSTLINIWRARVSGFITLLFVTSLLGFGVHHIVGASSEPEATHNCGYFEFIGVR